MCQQGACDARPQSLQCQRLAEDQTLTRSFLSGWKSLMEGTAFGCSLRAPEAPLLFPPSLPPFRALALQEPPLLHERQGGLTVFLLLLPPGENRAQARQKTPRK